MATSTPTPLLMLGTVNGTANLRDYPDTDRGTIIGSATELSLVNILAKTSDGAWYVVCTH